MFVAEHSKWVRPVLLQCQDESIRKAFSAIICIAIKNVGSVDREVELVRTYVEGKSQDESESLCAPLVDKLLTVGSVIPYFGARFNQYFKVFLALSEASDAHCHYLSRKGMVSFICHILLGAKSPDHSVFSYPKDKQGKYIDFYQYFTFDSTAMFQTLSNIVNVCYESLDEKDLTFLTCTPMLGRFASLGSNRLRGDSIGKILCVLCRDNQDLTDRLLVAITEGIEVEDQEGIRAYFRVLSHVLLMEDSIQNARVEATLSSILSVMNMCRKYWKATNCCIEHIMRLCLSNRLVLAWVRANGHRFQWIFEWMQTYPDPGKAGLDKKMKISKTKRKGNDEAMAYAQEKLALQNNAEYGFPMDVKIAILHKVVNGEEVEFQACEDSEDDLAERIFEVGMAIDCFDSSKKWCRARIVDVSDVYVKVSYDGWAENWDEWIQINSTRIAKPGTYVKKQ